MEVNRKSIVWVIIALGFIAGLLDIKYRGFFFKMLPCSLQKDLGTVFNHEVRCCKCCLKK